jgi:hypothetical protein
MSEKRPDAEGVPSWMVEHGIKKGEWLSVTKAQLKTQQRPDKLLKVQVWATGMLHTAGYQGQVAMTMTNGKKRPLMPADIIRELHAVSVSYFQKGGIQATPEQLESLKESKENMRSAIAELEADGVALRTDLKGRPLRDLSPEETRRLPSGKTLMYFWLKPRDPENVRVAQEWEQHLNGLKLKEVVKNRPPEFSIRQILKAFHVGKIPKSQLLDPAFQAVVTRAWESARLVFARELQVVISSLPNQVVTGRPPEVVTGTGAFERIDERIENHHHQGSPEATADLMMMTFERFHERTSEQFDQAGKPTPGTKLTRPVFAALHSDEDRQAFIEYLTPAKLKPIKSAGVLPDLLQNFRDARKAAAKRQEAQRAQEQQQIRPEDSCDLCQNSGIIGVQWNQIPEGRAAIQNGAEFCKCTHGETARALISAA